MKYFSHFSIVTQNYHFLTIAVSGCLILVIIIKINRANIQLFSPIYIDIKNMDL